jgi:peptidoglycan biosynthesis protein MviN/MurJ (putative lipid II flippase)
LLGLSSLCGVVTQMNHRFVLYAISPLLYNVGIIFGIAALYPIFGLYGLVFGVVLGAFGHVLVQVPFVVQSKYTFRFVPKIDWGLVKQVLAVSVPRALTLSVNQIVLLVLVGMASVMAAGSVSVFQFAFNLQSVPLAIIGMSYSVAAFPTLSLLHAKADRAGFNAQLLTAMRHIIFWAIPIAALVIVLRAQIVRVLLGSGSFDWADTRLTAAVLAVFVISLIAQAMLLLLIRAFYAGGRTVLPFVVALSSGIISVVFAVWMRGVYESSVAFQEWVTTLFRLSDVAGAEVLVLALAFVCGQFVQLLVLFFLSRSVFGISYRPLFVLGCQALFAGFFGGLAAYATLSFVVAGVNQDTFIGIAMQGLAAATAGVGATILAYSVVRAKELPEITRSFQAKIFKTDVIAPQ